MKRHFLFKISLLLIGMLFLTIDTANAQTRQAPKKAEEESEFENLKKNPDKFRIAVLLLQMRLGQLGYMAGPFDGNYDERTRRGVRLFRDKHAIKHNSEELDGSTFLLINDAWEATSKPDILLPRVQVNTDLWDSLVTAKGTFVIEGQKMGIPLQTTEIECHKALRVCIAATAMLQGGDYLTSWIETYEVERWDEHEIVTKPRDLTCTRYVMRVSRHNKTVSGLRSTTNRGPGCEGITSEDLRLSLQDGLSATASYREQKREAIRKHMLIDLSLFENK